MSNRDSLGFGDLLPQDVVEVFAQEKHSKSGRKKRSRSLGRALGWLKGKKNKNHRAKERNPGLGPALDLALNRHPAGYQGAPKGAPKSGKQGLQQGNSHAAPKRTVDDDKTPAPPLLQENVFIEVSRPKYLEDLHTEALEGLKMMQQEERIIGTEYQDNESTISTVSARAEVDGGGFTTDSTIPDTSSMVSVKSSVSSRSSRSGLTRQGSTFRPLNSEKKSEKGKIRRRHRKTIGGIPQHVQREFGLDRAGWTVGSHLEEEQFLNGEIDESPSTDVPQLAVHSPQEANNNTEVIQPLSVQEELSGSHAGHVDDMALLQRLGPAQSGGDRPWSLAVPGITTAGSHLSGPPSPVMSMSPQAAYLSKIIPNAVLPPSIEVVEISRGRSRNSVRTVSKSSLLLSSPTSSRASSRASSARTTSSRSSTITSASRQNHFHLSDSSCWSNSDSDTLVSDSSTISSSSTPRQKETRGKDVSKKQDPNASKYSSNGKIIDKADESRKDGQFIRSLSVMKPKRAPPPPSRSYSLHNKMKRRSRDLAEVKIITGQATEEKVKKIIDSPGYHADTSSLDESTGSVTMSPFKSQPNLDTAKSKVIVSKEELNEKKEALQPNNHNKVISPSSGYSSQDATSPNSSSPKHKKGILSKLHRLFPGPSTSAVTQPESASLSTVSENPSVKALREHFNIPPHPKVHAPPPPPPEVWSHSPRSIELLLGPPAPGTTYAIVKKNPKDKRPHRHSPPPSIEEERKQRSHNVTMETKKAQESQEGSINVVNRTNNCERMIQPNVDVKENGKVRVSEILNGMLVNVIERDGQRLPAFTEEHKMRTQTATNNPSISVVHISPNSPQTPTKQIAESTSVISVQHITSPESSWPPPPPPVVLGSPDETDFPLPPPPDAKKIVHQVPPSASNVQSGSSISLQSVTTPPLNIPPPPSYTAPPPPVKTFVFPEKVKVFSPQPKDISPPTPMKEVPVPPKVSKPPTKAPPTKEIILTTTEVISSAPKVIFPPQPQNKEPANKVTAIPPPPKAPPPPAQELLPLKVINAPPIKEVAASPENQITITKPTQPPTEFLPPPDLIPPSPPKEVPPPVLNMTAIPLVLVTPVVVPPAPPPPQVTAPPKEVSPSVVEVNPLPTEVSQSIKITEVTTTIISPPTSDSIDVSIPPPVEAPPKVPNSPPEQLSPTIVLPPQKEASPSKYISPPPGCGGITSTGELAEPSEEVFPPQKEVSPSQPPLAEVSPAPKDVPLPDIVVVEVACPKEMDSSLLAVEKTPVVVAIEVSPPLHPEETSKAVVDAVSILPVEETLKSQEDALSEENVVPPPDDTLSISTPHTDSGPQEEIKLLNEDTVDKTDIGIPSWKSHLTPPQSIPPPPPIEHATPSHNPPEPEVSPPVESTTPQNTETILVPPSEEAPKQEPASDNGENQSEKPAHAPVKQDEVPQSANHALSNSQTANDSPEITKPENEPKSEVTRTPHEVTNPVQTPSATTEAPQKPIRRSLIISSPPSPPATATTSATTSLLKPLSPNTVVTTTTAKSPPSLSPSMNLQEAIRLRTAARSHNGPSSRLSIPSPTGYDLKSPTSTASFIFSKSNNKVVTETRPEVKAEKKTNEEHAAKKEFKVPPPVAKKPQTKAKEIESGDMEQTAGQDTQSDIMKDTTKKPNGTAGTVGH